MCITFLLSFLDCNYKYTTIVELYYSATFIIVLVYNKLIASYIVPYLMMKSLEMQIHSIPCNVTVSSTLSLLLLTK